MKRQSGGIVLFEGQRLPKEAGWLELIPDILTDISEATREWTLDVHYCSGRRRSASSKKIIRCCDELIRAIDCRGNQLRLELETRLPRKNGHALLQAWRSILESIRQIASSRSECAWTAPVTASAIHKAGKTALFLFDAMAKNNPEIDVGKERKALKFIVDRHDDAQLHLLQKVLDGISSRSRRKKRD